MIRITVCRYCEDRRPGCHGVCSKYIKEREDQQKMLNNELDLKNQNGFQIDRIMDRHYKRLKKYGKW